MSNVPATSLDKRRGARKSAVFDLCLVDLGAGRSAMLLDVSELGIGVQAADGPAHGALVPVRFALPATSTTISGEGQIAWADGTGCMGIRFTSIAPEMKQALRNWVATEANPFFVEPEDSADADHELQDRIAELEAHIMVSEWAPVQSLNFLVDQIASMTRASGTAIALSDGKEIVCKASSGVAPQLGVRIDSRSGLSWECTRTGAIVHCLDTETDARVDRMLCRQLNMRSALLVPIKKEARVVGLVEVFSDRPQAFSDNTIALLKRVAEAVGALDVRVDPVDEAAKDEALAPPPLASASAAPQFAPKPPAPPSGNGRSAPARSAAAQPALAPEAPRKIENETPAVAAKSVAAAAPTTGSRPVGTVKNVAAASPAIAPAAVRPAPQAAPVQRASEAVAAMPAIARKPPVERTVQPQSAATRERLEKTAPAEVAAGAAVSTQASQAQVREQAPMFELVQPRTVRVRAGSVARTGAVVAVATVLLFVVGDAAWMRWGASATPATPSAKVASPAQQTIAAPVAPATVKPTPDAVAPAHTASTAATNTANTAPPKPKPVAAGSSTPSNSATNSKSTLEMPDPEVPVRVVNVPTGRPAPTPVQATPVTIPVPGTVVAKVLSSDEVPSPTLEIPQVSTGVTGGRQLVRVQPQYPPGARALHLTGMVTLRAHVNKAGKVSAVDLVSGQKILASAAVAAVKRWKYEPFRLNGEPVERVITVEVNFAMQQ